MSLSNRDRVDGALYFIDFLSTQLPPEEISRLLSLYFKYKISLQENDHVA